MTHSAMHSLQQQLLSCGEVDEVNEHIVVVVRSHADDVTVFALQCRASEDDARGSGFEGGDRLVAEEDQPVPAVGVGEGDAVCHFLDVGLRVELWGIFVLVRLSSTRGGLGSGLTASPSR